ncbi:LmrA/YxaF family transcription factor [Nocardia barduliensis]|uniref:LmrA/YxaF family transcription factor n=1 Tax=Nocardia barduliensis TaxID=2736643 RepID=UPI0015719ADD|nr:hypothetical protein [Nocardia barduliensis]
MNSHQGNRSAHHRSLRLVSPHEFGAGADRDRSGGSCYRAGCPVVAAALAESEPGVQAAAGEVFAAWHERLGAALVAAGVPAEEARSFSSFAFSAMEGAIVQARAMKSTRPLEDAQRQLTVLSAHYLPEGGGSR